MEDLFADTNTATGETVAYLDEVAENMETDVSGFNEDQQLSRTHGDTEENTSHAGNSQSQGESQGQSEDQTLPSSSRKRTLTASAPARNTAKKSKSLEVISVMTTAMTRPLEIVDRKNEHLIRDAIACWNREFKSKSSEVKLAMMEEWREAPGKALQFVVLDPHDREHLVCTKEIPIGS